MVRALSAANLPFFASNNLLIRIFLREHVRFGGVTPIANSLVPFVHDCYQADQVVLKELLHQKKVLVILTKLIIL